MKLLQILLCLCLVSISVSALAQAKKKAYIKYDLKIEKAAHEMISLEKLQAKYNYEMEMAWNKEWALLRKGIGDDIEIYFLNDREEQNQHIYVHNLKTNDKTFFPIDDHFKKDFKTLVASMKDYKWKEIKEKRKVAGCACSVYELSVAAFPHDPNYWCISEENKGFFTFHPFYENQKLGLPLTMSIGSSVKLTYEAVEISKNISEALKTFDKTHYTLIEADTFKKKHPALYHSIFELM